MNRFLMWLWGLFGGGLRSVTRLNRPRPLCGRQRCENLRDPRCKGYNCTEHCGSYIVGCGGRCLTAWEREQRALQEANDQMQEYVNRNVDRRFPN